MFAPRRQEYDTEKIAWIRLARTEGIGPVRMAQLISKFGSAQNAVEAFPTISAYRNMSMPNLSLIEDEIAAIDVHKAKIICLYEDAYPEALRMIADPPPVITVRGDCSLLHHRGVAIVGTRNASMNGRKFTSQLVKEIGEAEYMIASGMARGIDTAAHEAALHYNVPTVAVLAGGADHIYPRENEKLYKKLLEQGAVVSESAWGMTPNAKLFPKRNRIVSGLTLGTIIVEAALRSGSLITARLAAEQGREVFAVPGFPLDGRAAGPNNLIQQGAKLIVSGHDVLEDIANMAPRSARQRQAMQESQEDFEEPLLDFEETQDHDNKAPDQGANDDAMQPLEDRIVASLSTAPSDVDELIRALEVPASALQTALIMLEMEQKIERLHGNRVALCA